MNHPFMISITEKKNNAISFAVIIEKNKIEIFY